MLNFTHKDQFFTRLKSTLKTALLPVDVWLASGSGAFRPAAVLVPLFWKDQQLHVLLTKRSEKLKHHSGQISFPGGGFDTVDRTIRRAAIRETHEEIGITEEYIDVAGYLDNVETTSGFFVTPFVATLKSGFEIIKNEDEVSDVFSVPLSFFIDENNCVEKTAVYQGEKVKYYVYQYEKHTIWGVTAEIIVKLTTKLKQ